MKEIGVAILGLGVVGGGVYKLLTENREFYKTNYNIDITVKIILERRKERLAEVDAEEGLSVANIAEVCSNPDVDIVVEAMGGVEPAKSFVLAALNSGKSVVTSNKELYCKYSHELEKAAKKNKCGLFYEATCAGGVPVIRALLDNLQGNKISSLIGIINGTTNYILTNMAVCGASYDEVLRDAQKLGYAEADPSSDVDGYDAVYKLSILSSLCFHTKIPYTEIYREGISEIQSSDIGYGRDLGYALKLLAIGKNSERGIEVRVHPAFIKSDHPLANVNDSYNAVYITGDSIENVMLYGRGAGAMPTASAIVGDIIYCAMRTAYNYSPFKNTEKASPSTKFVKNFESEYYIRVTADDKAGVLSKITSLLSKHGVSIARFVQVEDRTEGKAPIIIITHVTQENNIKKAVVDINTTGLAVVESVIRVVE